MRFRFLALIATAAIAVTAHAQTSPPPLRPEESAAAKTEALRTAVGLDKAQTEKVSAINLKYDKRMEDARNGAGPPPMRARQLFRLAQDRVEEIRAVLTPAQRKILDERRDALAGPDPRP